MRCELRAAHQEAQVSVCPVGADSIGVIPWRRWCPTSPGEEDIPFVRNPWSDALRLHEYCFPSTFPWKNYHPLILY